MADYPGRTIAVSIPPDLDRYQLDLLIHAMKVALSERVTLRATIQEGGPARMTVIVPEGVPEGVIVARDIAQAARAALRSIGSNWDSQPIG